MTSCIEALIDIEGRVTSLEATKAESDLKIDQLNKTLMTVSEDLGDIQCK